MGKLRDAIKQFEEDTVGGIESGELVITLPEFDDMEYTLKSKPLHYLDYDVNMYTDKELADIYGTHPDRIETMIAEGYFPNVIVSEWDKYRDSLYIDTLEHLPESGELMEIVESDFNSFVEWLNKNENALN